MSITPALRGNLWAYAGLACIGLMWFLPFLYYPHTYPLASFYQEWATAMLGLCAMLLLALSCREGMEGVPRVVLLPVGLALLILLQYPLGKGVYWGYSLLAAFYLLWAALLTVVGQQMREKFGLPALAATLAAFLLAGAELNALFGMAQHFSWRGSLNYLVSAKKSTGIPGNLGQPNHYADHITLGLVSLGLLRMHRRMPRWLVALLAAPLLFALVLSASRSAWLYLPCLAVLAWLWQRRDAANRPLLHYSLLLLLGFGLMHLLVHVPGLSGSSGTVTSMDRLIAQGPVGFGGSSSLRLHVWYEAWLIFAQHPLLGAGFGQFAWQHFSLGPHMHNASFTGRWDNAHNIVMQTAAEMGSIGVLILLGGLALWARQACRTPRTAYHWWGYALLAVMGVHSLVEYPLWYAYFMGIAAFMLGVLDTTSYKLKLSGYGRASWGAAALLGLLFSSWLMLDYRKLQSLDAAIPPSAEAGSDYSRAMRLQQVRDGLTSLQMRTLLQPYIEGSLVKTGWSQSAEEGRSLIERRVHFMPENATAYLHAILLARVGRQEEARDQMERAIWSFPEDFPVALEKLRTLASVDSDTGRYPALLEFSLRKYEERRTAGY